MAIPATVYSAVGARRDEGAGSGRRRAPDARELPARADLSAIQTLQRIESSSTLPVSVGVAPTRGAPVPPSLLCCIMLSSIDWKAGSIALPMRREETYHETGRDRKTARVRSGWRRQPGNHRVSRGSKRPEPGELTFLVNRKYRRRSRPRGPRRSLSRRMPARTRSRLCARRIRISILRGRSSCFIRRRVLRWKFIRRL